MKKTIVHEIFCKQTKIVVITETIFKRIGYLLREFKCPHCRKFIQHEYYGTEEELCKHVVKTLPGK